MTDSAVATVDDEYLGDGVYASFDGFQIWLSLRAQDPSSPIALEPAVFKRLLKYKARVDSIVAAAEEAHGKTGD